MIANPMTSETKYSHRLAPGSYVYAAGLIAISLVNLALGSFDPTQAVPESFPARSFLAYAAALFLLLGGSALAWRRTTAISALALSIYDVLVITLLMNGHVIIDHYAEYGAYFGAVEGLALGAAALIIYASVAKLDSIAVERLFRTGRYTFGLCALFFGGAHFVYLNNTASLVPTWLPPSQAFWAYATGAFHITAGIALLTNVLARPAAILLTLMYGSFTPLVHLPLLLSDPSKHFFWTENALNLALVGCAWVVADSFHPRHAKHMFAP